MLSKFIFQSAKPVLRNTCAHACTHTDTYTHAYTQNGPQQFSRKRWNGAGWVWLGVPTVDLRHWDASFHGHRDNSEGVYLPAVIWVPSPPSTLLISSGGRRRLVRRGANDATSVGRRDKALGDDVCAALTDSDRRPLVGGVDSVRVSEGGVEKMFFRRLRQEMLCEKSDRDAAFFFHSPFFGRVCVESIYDFQDSRWERAPRQCNTPRWCDLEDLHWLLLLQEWRAASAPLVCYSANRVSGGMDLLACPLQEEWRSTSSFGGAICVAASSWVETMTTITTKQTILISAPAEEHWLVPVWNSSDEERWNDERRGGGLRDYGGTAPLMWFSLSVETNTRRCNLLLCFWKTNLPPLTLVPCLSQNIFEAWLAVQWLGVFSWKHLD